jgi:arylsulfatase A-like enzyme
MRCWLRLLSLGWLALTWWLASPQSAVEAANTRPNVLFCIADDASPHFGVYGCNWVKTPNIDRVAKAGLIFENVYTPTAKCAPSRAAILCGRNPWQLEEAANHQHFFPSKFKSFTESLRDAGVHVGAQGKTWGPGSAKTADGQPRDFGMLKDANNAANPGASFRKFLNARKADQPFFYWFGSSYPHRAYKLDSGIEAGKKPSDIDHVPAFWPDNNVVRRDMLDYAVEIEAYDAQVGSLLKVLEDSGELDNTLVIITSDHGMPFPRVKGHNYDMSNRVPFVAHWPNGIAKPGQKIADFVSLIDLAPTMLELFGVDADKSGMSPITGVSFTDLLSGQPTHQRPFVLLGRERNDVLARPGTPFGLGYPVRGIREGNLLYLHNFTPDRWPCGNPDMGLKDTDPSPTKQLIENLGESNRFWQFNFGKRPQEELFDLVSDPDCVKNLAEDANLRTRMTQLKEKLFAELERQNDPRVLGQGDIFDNYPSAKNLSAAAPLAPPDKKAPKNAKNRGQSQ